MADSDPETEDDTGADPVVDAGARAADLDPQAQQVVAEIDRLGVPEWSALSIESARRIEDEVFSATDPPAVERVLDVGIDGPGGEIPLRVYHPAPEKCLPALCFFHGGLWALGTLDSIDGVCRRLARRAERVVVSVDYRLAPEHPFPAGLEDCVAAVEWVAEHGEGVGADPGRIAVGGTSAGGNLAAATCRYIQRFGGPSIEGQTLLYPMVDLSLDYPSYDDCADGPLLTRRDVAWAHETYLRSPVDRDSPFAAPIRAASHASLPPAYIVTAGFDPLRDEGVAYAAALADAGVAVTRDHESALPHGFLSLASEVDAADAALDRVAEALRGTIGD
ncbi:alpha/beta hydrolase [Salinigranum sp. GCM10025319]|uniref:alpha/beta hydrolase n=1 Tax=Salinigranum sp. GCM10025319 TaxID=3252687 RepID=UPI0036212657